MPNNRVILWRKSSLNCFLVIGACLVVLIAGGCSNDQQNRVKPYRNDGYMGYSNSNPNLPNKYGSINYTVDGKLIEQVLAPIDGIEKTQIIFNGSDLHVNLNVQNGLSHSEVEALRVKAQQVVQFNMPRYDVHVEVNK